jgi:ribosomal protein L11 methyltransferase
MPYRVNFRGDVGRALDTLIDLGALDVEGSASGGAALMPDTVAPAKVAETLGLEHIVTSPAIGRDADSVWVLSPRPIRIGRIHIVPAGVQQPGTVQLVDAGAFGTGLHPTTALCLAALDEAVAIEPPDVVLDVGTGSGVIALAALMLGVPRARAIDTDADALRVASENARLNGIGNRLDLSHGGPESVLGAFPLVLANVLAAPLIEMAPALVQRVAHHGRLVLSGIPTSVEADVNRAYRQLGMRPVGMTSRAGWIALLLQATW